MIDIGTMGETLSVFFSGMVAVLIGLYGYAKQKGYVVLSKETEDTIRNLRAECTAAVSNLRSSLGNVTLPEAGAIVARGAELAKDGYTPAELMELGKMAVDAGAKNV